jgi:hypothetical protein
MAIAVAVLIVGAPLAGADIPDRIEQRFRARSNDAALRSDSSTSRLPATKNNVRRISHLDLTDVEGGIADVGYRKGYAYLAAWAPECPNAGVHVVDVRDPRNPEKVAFISSGEHDYVGEGVHVFRMNTPAFEGNVLAVNHEACDDQGLNGFSLYNVNDPTNPQPLVEFAGDTTFFGDEEGVNMSYHSVLGWSTGENAYVVGVDNFEFGAFDVDIFDVTDPTAPVLISESGLALESWASVGINANGDEPFHHDMEVRRIDGHWFMMASYWDAGWVLLNVDDPANPVVVDDSQYAEVDPEFRRPDGSPIAPPEGNAHQGEWNWNGKLFIGTDEDFGPDRPERFTIETGPNAGDYPVAPVGGSAPFSILEGREMNGPTVYGGYACPGTSDPVPQRSDYDLTLGENEEAILVVQRGPVDDPNNNEEACFPGEKAAEAVAAGWDAVVLTNRHISDPEPLPPFCGSGAFPDEPPIVAVCTTHEALHRIFNTEPDFSLPYPNDNSPSYTEPALGAQGETISSTGIFDGWGYVHLLDGDSLANLDTYVAAPARRPANAAGQGILSVHEVATDLRRKNIGYLAYYEVGLRVIKFGRARGIREVGSFLARGGNDFWGVQLIKRGKRRPLILMSDRSSGLWIFKYTGPE